MEDVMKKKIFSYLRMARISNLPTIWTNVLVGISISHRSFSFSELFLFISLCFYYIGGMFLNDAFDAKIDAKERKNRPIPSGCISCKEAFSIGFSLLLISNFLLFFISFSSGIWGIFLFASIVFYNFSHKNNPFSPCIMALCRFIVYIISAQAIHSIFLYTTGFLLFCYIIGLTGIARQEARNTFTGKWFLLPLFLPCVCFPFIYRQIFFNNFSLILYFLFLCWILFHTYFLLQHKLAIPIFIGRLIAGICLWDGLVISSLWLHIFTIVCLCCLVLTLFFQRYIPGS